MCQKTTELDGKLLGECGFNLHEDLDGKKVDIAHSTSKLYMENPTELHLLPAKRIIQYLQGTKDYGLQIKKGDNSDLLGYTNSNQDDKKKDFMILHTLQVSVVSIYTRIFTERRLILYKLIVDILMYMENPIELYLLAVKRIIRYLQGTKDYGLKCKKGDNSDLLGYTDNNQDAKKRLHGMFLCLEHMLFHGCRRSRFLLLSSIKPEFVVATTGACQTIYLRKVLEELKFKQPNPIEIYYDNNSAIKLSKNPIMHGRSKHIDVVRGRACEDSDTVRVAHGSEDEAIIGGLVGLSGVRRSNASIGGRPDFIVEGAEEALIGRPHLEKTWNGGE
ncbi:hypothetical protein V2J09_004543 [Rumex salicifolius]